jgi:hypothetical protein
VQIDPEHDKKEPRDFGGLSFPRKEPWSEHAMRNVSEVLPGRQPITERHLRRVLQSLVWEEQMEVWKGAAGASLGQRS